MKKINVTESFLPPIEDYYKLIERIWKNKWLSNNGELYNELIIKLKSYLDINHVIPMTNGTLPIQIALNKFANEGEVITTPFSYVATTSAIVWEKCKPIFVDINPKYLTIDETKIEEAVTKNTTAILATHVFGNPCHIDEVNRIAIKYNLKVIYDAAHCFGVKYKGQSIFNFGDVSTCSFHATKLFHTGEGGALFCKDENIKHEINYRHNFGHNGPEKYYGLGINAKMSELQAAIGLSVLDYMDDIFESRMNIYEFYNTNLKFINFKKLSIRAETNWNYSYYPLIFNSEKHLLDVKSVLEKNNIYSRRYFYPTLEDLPYIKSNKCPIAKSISSRILCLPFYANMNIADIKKIIYLINNSLK